MEDSHYQDELRTADADGCRNASQATTNSQYLATVVEGDVHVQRLADGSRAFAIARDQRVVNSLIIKLSPVSLSYLAIGHGTSINIYDIETQKITTTLRASSRCITALDWSPNGVYLASGSIDGAIHVWDLSQPNHPVAQCRLKPGLIEHIAWSKSADGMIAVVNHHGLHIWDRSTSARPVVVFDRKVERLRHLCWSQHHAWKLLASSTQGTIYVWDLSSAVNHITTSPSMIRPLPTAISLISDHRKFCDIVYLRWTSEQTAAILYDQGKKFAVVDLRSPGSIDWNLGFSHSFEAFDLHVDGDKAFVRMLSRQKQRTYSLPGKRDDYDKPFTAQGTTTIHETGLQPGQFIDKSLRTMSTTPIVRLRQTRNEHSHNGYESESQDMRPANLHNVRGVTASNSPLVRTDPLLCMPRLVREDSDSQMPFLSPAIPAKRPASNMDDNLRLDNIALPRPHSDGYFGSFSSATDHDSDSDDDGFDLKNGKDSIRLMPGGVNVPLPRSCGAVFSSDGMLVVFQPPQAKAAVVKVASGSEQIDTSRGDSERIARLFPTFGNLFAAMANFETMFEVAPSYELSQHQNSVVEALGLDKASYNSGESWKPHSLSTLPAPRPPISLPTIQISVRIVQDACLLDQQLARQYRVLVGADESGPAMCLANAAISIKVGRDYDALLWQALAKVIEDTGPSTGGSGYRGASSWADHPLGATWLVRRMYAMAEAQSCLQMLACITAVLLGSVESQRLSTIGSMSKRLAVCGLPTPSDAEVPDTATLRAVPRLRTEFNDVKYDQKMAPKPRTNSALSSRGPSLPTTPRLESSSSTPPWSFPSLTQSGSKLSLANSISPENARSSFSAAVKSYAQSVSDKFASYGTSPPIRKGGLSPSNELSSSLPGAGSSWTKSVSFASTAKTKRSNTFTAVSNDPEDDYNSDRTDDAVAESDRTTSDRLSVVFKNKDAFSYESLGLATRSLIPAELLPSCKIWTHAYAERLRSWYLNVQAVEFDKVGSALAEVFDPPKEQVFAQHTPPQLRTMAASCSICSCVIRGLEQICPLCQHAFHVVCLDQVFESDMKSLECPSGCGCVCSLLVAD